MEAGDFAASSALGVSKPPGIEAGSSMNGASGGAGGSPALLLVLGAFGDRGTCISDGGGGAGDEPSTLGAIGAGGGGGAGEVPGVFPAGEIPGNCGPPPSSGGEPEKWVEGECAWTAGSDTLARAGGLIKAGSVPAEPGIS